MKTYLIRTPEPGHTGEVGKVRFVDGVAKVTEDAQELHYFLSAGYGVEEFEPSVEALAEVDEDRADELLDAQAQGGTAEPDAEDLLAPADVTGEGQVVAPPRRNAGTEEWRTFMVGSGALTEDEAADLSRDELVARYTEEAQ